MREKIRSFMSGRNGLDQLNIAALVIAVVFSLLSNIRVLSFLRVFSLALWILVIFRMLSRNLARRQAENYWYVRRTEKLRGDVSGFTTRASQCREYKFFVCPGCKNRLRVPRGKGKIQITCPRCGHRFSAKS